MTTEGLRHIPTHGLELQLPPSAPENNQFVAMRAPHWGANE